MLNFQLNENAGILDIKPQAVLQAEDFKQLSAAIDAYLKSHPALNGVLIETQHFPGWQNMAALKEHIAFVKKYHRHIKKLALVTDSLLAVVGKTIGNYLLHVNIKHFSFAELDAAKQWMEL